MALGMRLSQLAPADLDTDDDVEDERAVDEATSETGKVGPAGAPQELVELIGLYRSSKSFAGLDSFRSVPCAPSRP